jgi:sugar/nucleoside kinase (ribokinase family)
MKIKQPQNLSDTFDLQFPGEKPFDVVGFGTNSVDQLCIVPEYPQIGSKTEILHYEKLAGGQVATAITFLSRMGLKTKYIGKVGGDDLGQFSLRSFGSESVDTSSIVTEKCIQNQNAIIVIDKKSGERTVLSSRNERLNFRSKELLEEHVCAGRILHLDGYDCAGSLKAAKWCRQQGIPVSIDLDKVVENCEELIKNVDFLIVSSNFPGDFTGIADPAISFTQLRNSFHAFLAVTLGAAGAMTWIGNQCVTFPGLKLNAVDTTGAGDIFHGGFIYGLLHNWSIEKIMRFANAAAGLSCQFLGAREGIRPLSEILSQLLD